MESCLVGMNEGKPYFTFLLIYLGEWSFLICFYGMDMDGCALHSQISSCVEWIFKERGGTLSKYLSADIFGLEGGRRL